MLILDSIEAESWAGGPIWMGGKMKVGSIGRATTSLGMGIPAAKAKRPANTTIITFTIKSMLEVSLLDASPFTKELSKYWQYYLYCQLMSKSTAIKLAPIIWEVGNTIFFWRYEVSESYESNQILTNFYFRVKIFLKLDFTQQNINNFESFRKLLNTLLWLVV